MKRIGIIFCVAAGLLSACTTKHHTTYETTPLKVKTQVVTPRSYTTTSRYVGTIEAATITPLSLQTAGRVRSIHCHEGERVREGQLLLTVDSTQAVNALRAAEATYHQAKDGHKRAQQVFEKGVISQQKMVEIESQLAQARSLYEIAQQHVLECRLFAPCEGVVSGLKLQIGQTVTPNVPLFDLMNTSFFCVRFAVPEAEIGAICIGQQGQVECTALDTILPIRVMEKSVSANAITHTYETTARIYGGEDILLGKMVGKVMLPEQSGTAMNHDVIVIPVQCATLTLKGESVWLVRNNQAHRQLITVDGYYADGMRVTSGLQAGDTLITEGYQKLYEGAALELAN